MNNYRDNLWRGGGPWIAVFAAWALLAACGAPPAPSTSPAPVGSAASEPSVAPPVHRTDAPPPVPVPQPAEVATRESIRPPVSSLAELAEHALPVKTYGAEDPSRCGLTAPGGGSPPSSVQVFFGCTPRSGPVVGAVPARVLSVPSGKTPEREALQALLAGPTAEERQKGYVSNFGDTSRGVEFEAEARKDGMALVNFDRAILEKAHAFVSNLDSRQVVATLGQFRGVQRVLILVEGEPLCKARGEC